MKKILLILLIGVTIIPVTFAQQRISFGDYYDDNEVQTVFKGDKRDGFYFSLSTAYSPINDCFGIVESFRAAWIMDHWFAIGFVGAGFSNNFDADFWSTGTTNTPSLVGGYGGLLLEPMLLPLKPIHLSFPIILGVGGVADVRNAYYNDISSNNSDSYYVIEPGVEVEINFARWLRFAIYGSYRYTSDISIGNIASDALRKYSIGGTVKIGLF